MQDLANFLKSYMREHGLTLRDLEQKTGVSRTVLNNLILGKEHEPRLSTMEGIAKFVGLPLWRIIELTGADIGLPNTSSQDAERLASLAHKDDVFKRLITVLLAAEAYQVRNVLNYLEHPSGEQVDDLRISIISDRQRTIVERLLQLQPSLLPNVPSRHNVYEGAHLKHLPQGALWTVTVNGFGLAEQLGWRRDFAWGYLGAGPMALAQAILSYEYGEETAHIYQNQFYSDVTTTLPQRLKQRGTIWMLESQEIDLWYMLNRLIERANPSTKPEPELRLLSERRREADG